MAQSSSRDPIIRVSVDLVQIDATVTDSTGRHVADLRPEDFIILEDGKRQTVTHFSYVTGPLASLAKTAPIAPAVQPSKTMAVAPIFTPAKPIAAIQVHRTIVLIADDLGLSADDIPNTRKAMKAWIDREMEPGDMLSVVTTSGGIGAMEQLTNDRARLYAAIDGIHFASGRVGQTWYEPTNIVYVEAPNGSQVGMKSVADPDRKQCPAERDSQSDAFGSEPQRRGLRDRRTARYARPQSYRFLFRWFRTDANWSDPDRQIAHRL